MERLQKLLSSRGVLSRRKAEEYIKAGRVTVNGQLAQLGQSVDGARDEILVDGKPIPAAQTFVYLMLNKPRGYVTTLSDEHGRKNVAELVADCGARVYPVGRLDLNSEGLLLLTNDGELTQKLTHPSHEVEKEYLVRVTGDVAAAIPMLRQDRTIEGVRYLGAKVKRLPSEEGSSALLSVTIHQGKNRQVRKMCAAAGLTVHRLRRVREGTLTMGELKTGQWRQLSQEEVHQLRTL